MCDEQERLARAWTDVLGELVEATRRLTDARAVCVAQDPLVVGRIKNLNEANNEARTAYYTHRRQHGC
jgi:hypothetical protein